MLYQLRFRSDATVIPSHYYWQSWTQSQFRFLGHRNRLQIIVVISSLYHHHFYSLFLVFNVCVRVFDQGKKLNEKIFENFSILLFLQKFMENSEKLWKIFTVHESHGYWWDLFFICFKKGFDYSRRIKSRLTKTLGLRKEGAESPSMLRSSVGRSWQLWLSWNKI